MYVLHSSWDIGRRRAKPETRRKRQSYLGLGSVMVEPAIKKACLVKALVSQTCTSSLNSLQYVLLEFLVLARPALDWLDWFVASRNEH